ncbi:MAG: NAD(P)-binding domain-containing protein, partial [Pseudomonadota bacterium]
MTSTASVIGLGSMGFGVARSLLRAGWQVYGFDMVEANVDRLVAEGGARAELADAVSQS